jgi:hypothetical protein
MVPRHISTIGLIFNHQFQCNSFSISYFIRILISIQWLKDVLEPLLVPRAWDSHSPLWFAFRRRCVWRPMFQRFAALTNKSVSRWRCFDSSTRPTLSRASSLLCTSGFPTHLSWNSYSATRPYSSRLASWTHTLLFLLIFLWLKKFIGPTVDID